MQRRKFLALLGSAAIAAPRISRAETSAKAFRLAVCSPMGMMPQSHPNSKVLLGALGGLGYKLGESLIFEGPAGPPGQLVPPEKTVEDLKARKVDVIVAWGYPVIAAAKAAGIPTVVAFGVGDPVATGLVNSLAHPGGVVTGISDDAAAISTKRLSLLKQMLPNMRRVAMLWNREDLGMTLRYGAAAQAAQALGVEVQALGVREPDDFNGVFEAMDRERPDAILMVTDILTVLNRKRVFDYATAKKIPAIYEDQQFARDGGLMAYGADPKESFERAADCCVRIFKGARPADIPFEQPTRYPFVINLKTAKAIGLEVPATLVALADEVIE